jgi:hypothetical protein
MENLLSLLECLLYCSTRLTLKLTSNSMKYKIE